MKKILVPALLASLSMPVMAIDRSTLERALTTAASEYQYEDEGFSCGGDIYSYKIISQDKYEIVVETVISAAVNYCANTIELNCVGTFNVANNGRELIYKDFSCDEPND